ncbi:MAG: FHA domain-containing protein [Magnetococcales bacterium]|nr:FHA domain-containing protein [Magnetococcales bacterium]
MTRKRNIESVTDLLTAGGRLDYQALERLSRECPEQHFVRLLGHWVLAGDEVMRGQVTPSRSETVETVAFRPATADLADPPGTGSLAEVIYLFRKPEGGAGGVQSFTLGRTNENDFVISDYAISRFQAVIHVTRDTRFRIRVLGGSNPVYVNQLPIAGETPLYDGDAVILGRFRFQLFAPSSLYLRLRGIQPDTSIRQLINAMGQADYKVLKECAHRHDRDFFAQLMRHPSLVGSGVFRGYGVRLAGMGPEATVGFLPDITAGNNAMPVRVLGRAIYPLLPPERIEEDGSEILAIGRGEDNDIRMPDDAISNRHARIRFGETGQYFLRDLNSTNGVFINGQTIGDRDREVFDGDRIKIGRHEFTLMFPSTLYHHLIAR